MSVSVQHPPTRSMEATAPGNGLAVLLLAVSAFVIVTTEFIIVGLLPSLSRDLGISISAAGQLVTLFAFTVMLFGPVLTAMLSHFERKRLFVVILLIFAGSNALAAAAPDIWVLGLGRSCPRSRCRYSGAPRARLPASWPDPKRPARRSPTSISGFPARWFSASRSARSPRTRSAGAGRSGGCPACRW